MTLEGSHLFPGLGIPDFDGLAARAGQVPAVGAKRHARTDLGVSAKTDQLLRRGRIPNNHGLVLVAPCCCDEAAVAAAGNLKVPPPRDRQRLLAGERTP